MIYFTSDYCETAAPEILEKLSSISDEQNPGYSEDPHCAHAAELIRNACENPDAAVHFLVGGTQTNVLVIASLLRPWQGVLCADGGHINGHETGALEARGHKCLVLPSVNGKINAAQVIAACASYRTNPSFEHVVQPSMVYISQPTEYGTLYSKEELTAMYAACKENGLLLFIDGARLGYGLAAPANDVTLSELTRLCDVFYIGGTKVGALFGEAVVFSRPALASGFRSMIKQGGGMLAKGFLLGIQFEALFTDGLYFRLGKHAMDLVGKIRDAFLSKGVSFRIDSPTNQLFPILSKEQLAYLSRDFVSTFWEPFDENHDVVRFCTSWATKEENVDALVAAIEKMPNA